MDFSSSSSSSSKPQVTTNHGPLNDDTNIEVPLSAVNLHLVCTLCTNYFNNACTVKECLHTFCRTCILNEFYRTTYRAKGGKSELREYCCPKCKVQLGAGDTDKIVMFDRSLQQLVDKIFPDLKRKRDAEVVPLAPPPATANNGSSSSGAKNSLTTTTTTLGFNSTNTATKPLAEKLNIRLINADVSMPALEKPFLRTNSLFRILQLKKYICKKLGLTESEGLIAKDIDILVKGEVVGDEFSLLFILRTRWRRTEDLTLDYRRKNRN
jgi:hypothetical protein